MLQDRQGGRRGRQEFRALYDANPDALFLVRDGRFVDCNRAALDMFGYGSFDALRGLHPSEISPPRQPGGEDSRRLAEEKIGAVLRDGSARFEWVHRRQDGSDFPAEVILSSAVVDGRPVIQAIVRPIKERKRIGRVREERLRDVSEEQRCEEAHVAGRTERAVDGGAGGAPSPPTGALS